MVTSKHCPHVLMSIIGISGNKESLHDQQHATGAQQLEGEDNNITKESQYGYKQALFACINVHCIGISGNKESLHDQHHVTGTQQFEREDNNTEESQESLHDQHHVTGTQQLEGEDNNITKESQYGYKQTLPACINVHYRY